MPRRDVGDEYDIDYAKLEKLEKMITRVDADINRMSADKDKLAVVETLKKAHDIYQLILGELHYQLAEMKLEKYGNLIQKIFLGENSLLNGLLKMKTNLEFNPAQMIETLEGLGARARRRNSSSHVSKAKETPQFMQIAAQNIAESKQAKLRQGMVGKQNGMRKDDDRPVFQKVLIDRSTDTGLDRADAKNLDNVLKKTEELDEIKREMEESAKQMDNFLKEKRLINFDSERSKAESQLKNMLKDLTAKKRKAEQAERDGEDLLIQAGKDAERKARQDANAALIFGGAASVPSSLGGLKSNAKGISIETQTEKEMGGNEDKLNAELKVRQTKLIELEKKLKEAQKDADIFKETTKKLNEKISEMTYAQKKLEEDVKKEKDRKESKVTMTEKDKNRFKALVEDNYRMKYKLKELVDAIKALDKKNKGALDDFKMFIMNSNLTDEQKRMLLGKAEEMFKLDICGKLNVRDLEVLSKIDNEMLRDPLIRNIIGDPVAMVKKLKQEEQEKVLMRAQPNYNPDFDPTLLEEGQKITTRKVKKKVKVLNENGEWVEQEIEVEEEVVLDKFGKVLRVREKVREGATMDPSMQSFVNSHGGLAIGGAKFKLPVKAVKPMAQNGAVIKENEWFVDQKGNKVKMTKNAKGEEVYEVQEEIIDEYGNKKVISKKIVSSKDKDGNEVITEEFIDPKTGKKVVVQKKAFKDKDGVEVNEEVTIDANGRKITKRVKVLKDKDGNEVIEEETIDEFGQKVIVRRKKIVDANGNETWVTETINADGSRKVVTEKMNAKGEKIIQEETIDKFGKKTVVEKKVMLGKDGKIIVEETSIDANGVRVVKNIRQSIDRDGHAVNVEETVDEKGQRITKRTKEIVDKDGNRVQIEEITDANGNKITRSIKKLRDAEGNEITIEETVDEFGNKITKVERRIKKRKDKDGNEIVEEEVIDANGAKIVIITKKNKDGSVEEERYNPATGERVTIKKKVDASGREIIEEIHTDKYGKQSVTRKVIETDANGNRIVEESFVDPLTGEKVVIKKTVKKDANGNDVVEEIRSVNGVTQKTVQKRVTKDSDGREVIEEEFVDENGKKMKVRTKVYRDKDGNEIIEEERVDENGNRVIVKRKKDKDGREIIEEVKLDKNGKQISASTKIVEKNGMIVETHTDAKGNVSVIKRKVGSDDKQVQVGSEPLSKSMWAMGGNGGGAGSNNVRDLEQMLVNLGCSQANAVMIAAAIMDFILKGVPFTIGGDNDENNLAKIKDKHNGNLNSLKEQRKKDLEDIRKNREAERIKKMNEIRTLKDEKINTKEKDNEEDESNLLVIDEGLNENEQTQAMFNQLKGKDGPGVAELNRNIRNMLGLPGNQEIKLEHFQEYFQKYKQVHSKCGENCLHLKRFYMQLGFIQAKYKRKFLQMKPTKINAFKSSADIDKQSKVEKLPKISSSRDFSEASKSQYITRNNGGKDYETSIFKTHSNRHLSTDGGMLRQSDGEETDRYDELNGTNPDENSQVKESRRGSIEEELQ